MMSPKRILFALWSFSLEVLCRPGLARMPAGAAEAGQCGFLNAPWSEVTEPPGDWSHIHRLKVFQITKDGPNKLVFPEQPLFRFVRRVYRCCRLGHHCGGVKGIQGREAGGSIVEFLLSEDVLSTPVLRAEVHLHVSNPHHLTVTPLLPWLTKRHLPTRYTAWSEDGAVELRVDLLFLFQTLQALRGNHPVPGLMEICRLGVPCRSRPLEPRAVTTVDGWRDRPPQAPTELGLALHCSTVDQKSQLCESHGVRLLHTPFITLSYG